MVPLVICACGTCGISVMILGSLVNVMTIHRTTPYSMIVSVGFLLCDASMCPFFTHLFAGVSSFVFRTCCLSFLSCLYNSESVDGRELGFL